MPLYGVKCDNCGMKIEVLRNMGFKQEQCPDSLCPGQLHRIGIELQKRPHVQSGSSNAKYRN
jgi:predicted nucleic acid-binding Zn ribbon protein